MEKVHYVFDAMCGKVDKIVRVVLVIFLLMIVVLVTGQVALRLTGGSPFFWVAELSGYLFAYISLLGASVCLRSDTHIRVPLLLERVPRMVNRTLVIVIYLIAIIYGYHLGWFGYRYAMLGANELTPSSSFIEFWPRLALAIGGFLLVLQGVCLILRELSGVAHVPASSAFGNGN